MVANLARVERESVQEHNPYPEGGGYNFNWFNLPGFTPGDDLLPPWGTHYRDRRLRYLYRTQYAWIAQASVAALAKRVVQTPYLVQGGRNLASYYTRLLQEADFQAGWDTFLGKLLLDVLTCDYGGYVEIIGAGPADKPLRGRVMGIAHLDSLRCVPTGNPEYPVVYWSRWTGKMHLMHRTRVHRFIDMIDGDELWYEPGLCALSRAISMLDVQAPMQNYVAGMMKEIPAAGVMFLPGYASDQWYNAKQEYDARRANGYRGFMSVGLGDSQIDPKLVNFSTAPEGFDFGGYTELAVNVFAAAFGIDRQDIWPLTGRMSGTATQSQVLAEKARGMGFGNLLKMIERFVNTKILPPGVTFEFQFKDTAGDVERTNRDQAIVATALQMRGLVDDAVIVRYIASQSEAWRDVLTDESGQLVEMPDDQQPDPDAETPDEPVDDVTVEDNASAPTDAPAAGEDEQTGQRAIQATRLAFDDRLEELLSDAVNDQIRRSQFAVQLRDAVNVFGTLAYRDGLIDGGVADGTFDDDDRARVAVLLADQMQYIRDFTNKLFDGGVTERQAALKPELWYNKSISPFYDAGRLSADKNGNYEWVLGRTEQHCADCLRLNGQVHRYKSWAAKNLIPRSSKLECGGWLCDCDLLKTNDRARGRF